jgi:putative ABC transport system permease protein
MTTGISSLASTASAGVASTSSSTQEIAGNFTQFLTLVGLAALLVGGVGVANAVKSHIDRRRDVILGRERVAAGKIHFRAALGEDQA